MSVETFLSTTTGLVAALTALVAALISLFTIVDRLWKRAAKVFVEPPPGQAGSPGPPGRLRPEWPLLVVFLLLQIFVVATSMAVGRSAFPARAAAEPNSAPPRVEITSPLPGQPVDVRLSSEGSGEFFISGSSSGVANDPDRRVYVLVHAVEPWMTGWWVQNQATVDPRNGDWTSQNWFGDRNFTPGPGHRLQVVAVVAGPLAVMPTDPVADPKDLRPLAQSSPVTVTVGAARRE